MLFINNAYAQTAAAQPGVEAGFFTWLPILLMFVVFYFLVLRPQSKRAEEHAKMLENLQKGDRVLTNGGFYADVVKVNEGKTLILKLADGVEVEFAKTMIAEVVTEEQPVKKESVKLKKKK